MDSDSDNSPKVEHQPKNRQFICKGDAVLQYEIEEQRRFVITHTSVPVHMQGRGIAAKLAETALTYAEQNQYEIVAQCSYIASYMKRRSKDR
ncbi:GNAT family N-acetyltransferase [Cerasicoccus arenae]|uniref:N-acetyltransferase domain-containing protein n=1 Tax=Cerasicoccus arenae TaxID=424488 RepID=A0A8J3DCP1_9BACT|nr:GNAT family N-acetyltransferase [Cerasicoccus arenae]MBK1858612.1 N-acetyltransferase [Cerasicoccus arenae]GHC05005.1 hypothetical protein GCM10007047_22400 [Cerasicoccus arenae]